MKLPSGSFSFLATGRFPCLILRHSLVMQLIEVRDKKTAEEFILANVLVNKGNPHYIRPLDKDIRDVFDPKKNKAYRFGTAIRWILKNDGGELIGRIAAF